MLKGQAKKDFEKWFNSYIDKQLAHNRDEWSEGGELLSNFYELPFSMQYGVIIDWFDSVGINISIEPYWCVCKLIDNAEQELSFDMMVFSNSDNGGEYSNHTTRTQARQKAIEQANTIYNERT